MQEPDWQTILAADEGVALFEPSSPRMVEGAEASLQAVLPGALRALYLVTDGVLDTDGEWLVIWPLRDVVDRNLSAWVHGPTARRELLAFGDDGTGAPFCVPRGETAGVFVWQSIEQRAYRLADSIEEFWRGWRTGSLTT